MRALALKEEMCIRDRFCIIGEKKWTPLYDEHGLVEMQETVDLGLTVDERIADGYYYARACAFSNIC